MDDIQTKTENFMNEFITKVQCFQQQIETYKHVVGCKEEDQTYSKKFQQKFVKKFVPHMENFINPENNQQIEKLDRLLLGNFVFLYAYKHPDLEIIKDYYQLLRELAQKHEDSSKLKPLMNKIYTQIPQAEKEQIAHYLIDNMIAYRHANNKMVSEYNSSNVGYCLQGIIKPLKDLDKKYHYCDFLPQSQTKEDEQMYSEPDVFAEVMKENPKTKNHFYESSADKTFRQLIDENNIQKGAIIILYNNKGEGMHAMFWDGNRDGQGEPLLLGFNNLNKNEEHNVIASCSKNGRPRIGAIIDIHALVKQGIINQQTRTALISKETQHR